MTTHTTTTADRQPSETPTAVRGISALRHPVVSGGLIGVIGGTAFLFAGLLGVSSPTQGPLRGLAAALATFTLAVILFRRRVLPELRPPAPGAARVYGVAVVVMLLLMPVTRLVAQALHAPTAQSALVAAVVGAHFLPFARVFHAPVFWWIGGSMVALGLGGALLAVLGMHVAGPAGAAAAGAAMLVIVAVQAFRQHAPGTTASTEQSAA